MKNIIFLSIIAILSSCHKSEQPQPVYPIQNTSWTESRDTNFHISFSASSMIIQYPPLNPNPSGFICSFSNDTIFVPQLHQTFSFKISKDSLFLFNIKMPDAGYRMFRQ